MSKLEEIISNKRGEIPGLKEALSGGRYPSLKKYSGPSFLESLKNTPDFALIAEVKRKSPSQGSMAGGENPVEIARIFDEAGVNAISVLTDRKYFDGDFSILRDISSSVKAPLLCKDFIIDRVQVDMALASGAAAVLLITEALDDASLESLYNYTLSLGLDALVEAHFSRNVKRAVDLGARIIGINNRNLDTLEEKPGNAASLSPLIPEGRLKLSLSSCRSRIDAIKLSDAGLDGVLIGAAVMVSEDRKAAVRQFLNIRKGGPV